jgi:hypothetical protein
LVYRKLASNNLCFVSVFFLFKIDDLGGRRGDTAQALPQWQHPVSSSEALDVVHWVMCSVSYRRIRMVIKIASKVCILFCIIDFIVINNLK